MRFTLRASLSGFAALACALACARSLAAQTVPVQPLRAEPAPAKTATADDDASLGEVVVTGTRTRHTLDTSPVEVQLIGRAQIEKSGARDVAELLQREGGVYVTPVAGRGTSIEIQGLSSDQVLILVDGRRMIGRINGAIDLTRLRLDSVERIEIVKGPTSALYGADALGGVVNIITRRGRGENTLAITARADNLHNGEISGHGDFSAGPVDGTLSGGWLRIQPYDLDARRPGTDGIEGDSRYFSGNALWQAAPGASVDFYGAYSLDDTLRTDGGIGGNALYDTRKRIEEVRVGAAPQFALGQDTTLSVDTYYNRYYDQYLQIQQANEDNVTYEKTTNQLYSAGAQVDHTMGDHQLTAGGEFQYEQLEADRLSSAGERDRESVYLQDQWQLGNATLVPGLRYDRDSQFGSQVSPKLALRYQVSDEIILRAGYGRGYRAPDFKQLLLRFDNPAIGYRVEGNPELQPERGSGLNAGVVWLPDPRLDFSTTVFANRVNDLIDIVQVSAGNPIIYSYRNVESALLQGVDAQLRLRPLTGLELGLGYGWLDAKDRQTDRQLSGRARDRINFAASWQQSLYALSLRGIWIGERVFDVELDSGGAPLPAGTAAAYTLMDARAEWLGVHGVIFAAGVKNLLDEGEPQYLPLQPRTGYLEIKWNIM